MYLAMLNNEKKHLFLNLEIYLSRIDGDFSVEEKRIIDVHCIEMHIDNNNYEADMSLDDVFHKLKETLTHTECKIVYLELVATILADDEYHKEEERITSTALFKWLHFLLMSPRLPFQRDQYHPGSISNDILLVPD